MKKQKRKIAVIDAETDPFEYDRIPKPFCWGFFDGTEYRTFWGSDCTTRLLSFLATREPLLIYAHNGGHFDFYFLLDHLANPLRIINSRIVECSLGKHLLRDSWAIMPFKLAEFKKDEIDYKKMREENREFYKAEIIAYLRTDCVSLHTLCTAFFNRFGDRLTIGGTSLAALRELHPFENTNETHDATFRPFYFGGRVQAIERGILKGRWRVYDVNSMYPHVMASTDHPQGFQYSRMTGAEFNRFAFKRAFPYFVEIDAVSIGALPVRDPETGKLEFPHARGIFLTTSHEFETGISLGLLRNVRVRSALVCESKIRFDQFVKMYSDEKTASKLKGDQINYLFSKYLLNSAYGKTGQNPENYKDFHIRRPGEDPPEDYLVHPKNGAMGGPPELVKWKISTDFANGEIYERDSTRHIYYDVAIAASITGAARATLMRALSCAKRPIYCDTDSLVCEDLGASTRTDASELGAWKLEATADTAVIIGRKLYGLFKGPNSELVKAATKGFSLSSLNATKDQRALDHLKLFDIARGAELEFKNDAPNFKLDGSARFTRRKILREFLD